MSSRKKKPTPQDWELLQSHMCQAALSLVGYPDTPEHEAYEAMLREPDLIINWWCGAFEQSESDQQAIESGARALAHGHDLPDLTPEQRGRLALRLRLASRVIRAISSRHQHPATGWFPEKLASMEHELLLEWLLIDAAGFWIEIFDESFLWADGVRPPKPLTMRIPTKAKKKP